MTRGDHLVLGRHPVQPDRGVAVAHLGVHDRPVLEAVQAPGAQAEGGDEEVVGRLDVLVDEDGDDGGLVGVGPVGVVGGHTSTMRVAAPLRLGRT